MPYVLFLLVCGIWGSSFILMKKAALVFGPISVGAWRVIGGAVALAIICRLQRRSWLIDRRYLWPLLGVSVIGYAWPYALQPYLVVRHGSGFIAMMVSFVPLLTIVVSVPVLGVYPTPRQLLGVIGGLICMGIVMADGMQRNIPPFDLALAFTVPLSYSIINAYIRLRFREVSSLALTASALALTGAALLPLAVALPSESLQSHDPQRLGMAIIYLLLLGIVATGLATAMFNKLILEQGPLFASMVTYLIPTGALLWGWLDEEHVSLMQLSALAGVFVMVAIVQFGAARRPATGTEPEPIDEVV